MKNVLGSALVAIMLLGCAATDSADYDTEDLWADYCATGGGQVDRRTGVTVLHRWDDEATTAGHRGTRTNDTMEPDPNQAPPHGC